MPPPPTSHSLTHSSVIRLISPGLPSFLNPSAPHPVAVNFIVVVVVSPSHPLYGAQCAAKCSDGGEVLGCIEIFLMSGEEWSLSFWHWMEMIQPSFSNRTLYSASDLESLMWQILYLHDVHLSAGPTVLAMQ